MNFAFSENTASCSFRHGIDFNTLSTEPTISVTTFESTLAKPQSLYLRALYRFLLTLCNSSIVIGTHDDRASFIIFNAPITACFSHTLSTTFLRSKFIFHHSTVIPFSLSQSTTFFAITAGSKFIFGSYRF